MKKEIEQVIHNAAVEDMKTNPDMMNLLEKYDKNEITLDELKTKVFELAGIKC